jgi:hypothetical protein
MNPLLAVAVVVAAAAVPLAVQAQVWRCETDSGVPLYQNSGGPRCKPLDLPVITTLPAPQPAPGAGASGLARPAAAGAASGATSGSGSFPKVDTAAQRARDQDRRDILEAELRKEESRLAEFRDEFRGGEPERRGDERNYQRYLDRVQRLKDDIARSEAAIASLKRELASLRP